MSSQSGVDITYNGVTQTVSEVVGVAGGQKAITVTKRDAFDRLVQVQEQQTASPITWARTNYAYGPDDNITKITDPQGAVTTLTHDMGGRRTAITRAGKTWRYGYDANGNVTSEQAPCSPAGTCEVNYTSTIAYDALDRPLSKLNAPRALSSADQTLFGSAGEAFTYDTGPNGFGRLVRWESYAPGARIATTTVLPSYDLQGNRTVLREDIKAAGFSLSRDFVRFYALGGQPLATYYHDVVGGSACTDGSYSQMSFDKRGLPASVQINGCLYAAGPPYHYVSNTRNVAGLVTQRKSLAGANAPFTRVQSDWTYDKLGRVVSQAVKENDALDQVARQDLTYFGNDDPKTLNHWLGATNKKTFSFTYDPRHQLKSVSESTGSFSATYAYGAAGRFSTAKEAAMALPNSNVKPRDVSYVYASSDPEQVVALKKMGTTTNLASYAYDLAGNQTTRDYVDTNEHWDYVYDGKNQLRRATKKVNGVVSGSEEYWYDQAGDRMLVVKRDGAGNKTELVWFIGDTEAHYSAAGVPTRVFGHVSMGTPVFRLDRDSDGAAGGEYQFHGLASNTLASIENGTGTVNASFVYAPFGEVIEATNAGGPADGAAAHRRRMNDKYIDEVDELAYYGARYYDRTSMTWTQSDPAYRFTPDAAWANPRRATLYTMSLNNPNRYIDPDGRSPLTAMWGGAEFGAEAGSVAGPVGTVVGAVTGAAIGLGVYYVGSRMLSQGAGASYTVNDARCSSCHAERLQQAYNDSLSKQTSEATSKAIMSENKSPGGSETPSGTDAAVAQEEMPTATNSSPASKEKASRQHGDRMGEERSLSDALDQLDGITEAQRQARKSGVGDATIQSTKKSKQNVQNRLDRIKSAADLDDDDDLD